MTPKSPEEDSVDRMVQSWAGEMPNVDLDVEAAVQRIAWINRKIRRRMDETLADFDLSYEEWGLLGHLRHSGPPYRSSPSRLAERQGLSSGAMTNRLDRLEKAGLLRRLPDPGDRRSIHVELTEKGLNVHRETVDVQAEKEAVIADTLGKRELVQLNNLLRKVLAGFKEG